MAAPRKCEWWQIVYVRRAVKLRRKLSNKALARRFGVSEHTIHTYSQRNMRPQ